MDAPRELGFYPRAHGHYTRLTQGSGGSELGWVVRGEQRGQEARKEATLLIKSVRFRQSPPFRFLPGYSQSQCTASMLSLRKQVRRGHPHSEPSLAPSGLGKKPSRLGPCPPPPVLLSVLGICLFPPHSCPDCSQCPECCSLSSSLPANHSKLISNLAPERQAVLDHPE